MNLFTTVHQLIYRIFGSIFCMLYKVYTVQYASTTYIVTLKLCFVFFFPLYTISFRGFRVFKRKSKLSSIWFNQYIILQLLIEMLNWYLNTELVEFWVRVQSTSYICSIFILYMLHFHLVHHIHMHTHTWNTNDVVFVIMLRLHRLHFKSKYIIT